jgi:hypothetical protein
VKVFGQLLRRVHCADHHFGVRFPQDRGHTPEALYERRGREEWCQHSDAVDAPVRPGSSLSSREITELVY